MKLDLFKDEYRCGILATDDMTEVRVYISSIWIYRRGLCTTTSDTTYTSHNHKLQMCKVRRLVICLRLSSVVVYEQYMAYPRLELIYCPNRYIEEICRLQFASTRMNCTIQTLNASKIGYQIWSKLSIFVVVWSFIVKKGTKIDMLPT